MKTSQLWRFAFILVVIFLLKLTVAHAQHQMRVSVSEYKADIYIDGKLTTKKGSFEITVPKGGCVEVAAEAPGFERQTVKFCQDKKTKLPTTYQMTLKKGAGNAVSNIGSAPAGNTPVQKTEPEPRKEPKPVSEEPASPKKEKVSKAKQADDSSKEKKEPKEKPVKSEVSPSDNEFRLGFRAAGGLARGVSKGNGFTITSDFRIGAMGGLVVDLPLGDLVFVQSGLMYALKGGKSSFNEFGVSSSSSSTIHYVKVPINVGVKFDLGGVKPFLMAGPYVAVGLFGNVNTTVAGRSRSQSITFGNGSGANLRRLDYGATFGGGVELAQIPLQIFAAYDLGLANLVPGGGNITSQNRFLYFGVNFFFK